MLNADQRLYIFRDIKKTWENNTTRKKESKKLSPDKIDQIDKQLKEWLQITGYILGLENDIPFNDEDDYSVVLNEICMAARFPASIFPFPEVTQQQGNGGESVFNRIGAVKTSCYFETIKRAMQSSVHGSFFSVIHSFLFSCREVNGTVLFPITHKGMHLGILAYFPEKSSEVAEEIAEDIPKPEFDVTWGGLPAHAHALRILMNTEGYNKSHFIIYILSTEQNSYYISNFKEYFIKTKVSKNDMYNLRKKFLSINLLSKDISCIETNKDVFQNTDLLKKSEFSLINIKRLTLFYTSSIWDSQLHDAMQKASDLIRRNEKIIIPPSELFFKSLPKFIRFSAAALLRLNETGISISGVYAYEQDKTDGTIGTLAFYDKSHDLGVLLSEILADNGARNSLEKKFIGICKDCLEKKRGIIKDLAKDECDLENALLRMLNYDTSSWAKSLALHRCFALPLNKAYNDNSVLVILFPYPKKDLEYLVHDISQALIRLNSDITNIQKDVALTIERAEHKALKISLSNYGHTMGHRLDPIRRYFKEKLENNRYYENCKNQIIKCIAVLKQNNKEYTHKNIRLLEDTFNEILCMIELQEKSAHAASVSTQLVGDISLILQAHSFRDKEELFWNDNDKKGRFLNNADDLDLIDLIEAEIKPFAGRDVVIKIMEKDKDGKPITKDKLFWRYPETTWEGISSAVILREIENNYRGQCRLKKAFYTQLFNELIINCVNHSMHYKEDVKDNIAPVCVTIRRGKINNDDIMIIENPIAGDIKKIEDLTSSKDRYVEDGWVRWPHNSNGPSMIIAFFRKMFLGDLYVRYMLPGDKNGKLQIGLQIYGMKLN